MTATYLLCVDLESTGIDLDEDEIIEAAFILTDTELEVELGRWHRLIPPTPDGMMRLLSNKKVREMHVASGLLDALVLEWDEEDGESGGMLRRRQILEALTFDVLVGMRNSGVTPEDTVHLAGSGVAAFDQPMIKRWLPELAEVLHYAPIDVGVPRRMIKMWRAYDISSDNANKTHRAMDDCEGSLNELRAVKRFLTKPEVHTIYAPAPLP